eukprot:COSAG02_NODE_11013_length_1811_cov_2.093458_1_plen_202_part_00
MELALFQNFTRSTRLLNWRSARRRCFVSRARKFSALLKLCLNFTRKSPDEAAAPRLRPRPPLRPTRRGRQCRRPERTKNGYSTPPDGAGPIPATPIREIEPSGSVLRGENRARLRTGGSSLPSVTRLAPLRGGFDALHWRRQSLPQAAVVSYFAAAVASADPGTVLSSRSIGSCAEAADSHAAASASIATIFEDVCDQSSS